eukprot:Ihof_evm1s793 gene=Ihof_evmTU1s793
MKVFMKSKDKDKLGPSKSKLAHQPVVASKSKPIQQPIIPPPSVKAPKTASEFASERKTLALAERANTEVSHQILRLEPQERMKVLEKKIEEFKWELENEQIIYTKLKDMPLTNRKKAFINELALQMQIVEDRTAKLSQQIARHEEAWDVAKNSLLKGEVSQKEEQLSELKNRLDTVTLQRNHLQILLAQREEEFLSELDQIEMGRHSLGKHVLALNAHIAMLTAEKMAMETIVHGGRVETTYPNFPPMVAPYGNEQTHDSPGAINRRESSSTGELSYSIRRGSSSTENSASMSFLLHKSKIRHHDKARPTRERNELLEALHAVALEKAEVMNALDRRQAEVDVLQARIQDLLDIQAKDASRIATLETTLAQKENMEEARQRQSVQSTEPYDPLNDIYITQNDTSSENNDQKRLDNANEQSDNTNNELAGGGDEERSKLELENLRLTMLCTQQ